MGDFKLPQLGVSESADRVRAAIGAGDWEEVLIQTPQFDRVDGNEPWWFPKTAADLDAIRTAPAEVLRSMGCGLWDNDGGQEHWLYPAEWYDHIPEGHEMVSISGQREPMQRGVTDDDRRMGVLAYGFTRALTTGDDR
jgi:hypothetical protein